MSPVRLEQVMLQRARCMRFLKIGMHANVIPNDGSNIDQINAAGTEYVISSYSNVKSDLSRTKLMMQTL